MKETQEGKITQERGDHGKRKHATETHRGPQRVTSVEREREKHERDTCHLQSKREKHEISGERH